MLLLLLIMSLLLGLGLLLCDISHEGHLCVWISKSRVLFYETLVYLPLEVSAMRKHPHSRLYALDDLLDHVLFADGQALLDHVVAELVAQQRVYTRRIVDHYVAHKLLIYFV